MMPADLSQKEHLLAKIAAKEATVAIIGLGYVAAAKKPEALHRGESYIKHIGPERVAAAFARGRIAAHARPGQLVVLESTTYPGTTREEIVPEHPQGRRRHRLCLGGHCLSGAESVRASA